MNAVEIEEAVSLLAAQPFDAAEFPYAFLEAFGNDQTTLKRLRTVGKSSTNRTDLVDSDLIAVLQRLKIHLAVCPSGRTAETLKRLVDSPATTKHKVKFALAVDGQSVAAQNLVDDAEPPLACDLSDLGDAFGYFLPLANIYVARSIKENPFDIKATGRLNKLYVELLRHNPDWDTDARRRDLNHFFARLIFCFFAEDTGIFHGGDLFTATVRQMSDPDGNNTHAVLAEVFRAMNVKIADRPTSGLRNWAQTFPYVNGGLFGTANGADAEARPTPDATADADDVPRFTRSARNYLLFVGDLDWTRINPDIFGSMIQAVADDAERGALGMHYTSVPNILKVLGPLFLDDLRDKLAKAIDPAPRPQALRHLRRRLARIRVFDPACGSGNFLVIAYKHLRDIEATINKHLGEADRPSEIPLTNFRGIELRHFAAEVARLALIIAEYQCDVLHRGPTLANAEFLPLNSQNWITCGNALRLDWLSVCPPTGTGVKLQGDDLCSTPLDQAEMDFANEGGETYICGNPPYLGSKWQSDEQKADLGDVFDDRVGRYKSLDYIAGWFMKAADYSRHAKSATAFVSTNSICQGEQVAILWPTILKTGNEIRFARTSFKWTNLASHNAGVTVVIVGLSNEAGQSRPIYTHGENGETSVRHVDNINPYLIAAPSIIVTPISEPISDVAAMQFGNHPYYGMSLIFSSDEARRMLKADSRTAKFVRPLYGGKEFITASPRACLWIADDETDVAAGIDAIAARLGEVAAARSKATKDKQAQKLAAAPHRFRDRNEASAHTIVMPRVSSESRHYLPVGVLAAHCVVQDQALALYDAPLWNLALIASRLHLVWVATVCGKLETRYRYSNTLGWNTFPVPPLSEGNKAELTRRAEDILLAREAFWPATIAELYDPAAMDAKYPDLRAAHERNDETLERLYVGRRFRNDTERLEHLFGRYTEMTGKGGK